PGYARPPRRSNREHELAELLARGLAAERVCGLGERPRRVHDRHPGLCLARAQQLPEVDRGAHHRAQHVDLSEVEAAHLELGGLTRRAAEHDDATTRA